MTRYSLRHLPVAELVRVLGLPEFLRIRLPAKLSEFLRRLVDLDRRPDRANPMKAGAAPANQRQINGTNCSNDKSRFALFRHGRRPCSGLLRAQHKLICCIAILLFIATPATTRAQATEGIAESVRQVDVASPEAGTIEKVLVRQGQKVKKGDPLVQMDSEILLPTLQLAKAKSEIRAKLDAARIEVQVKQRRLENLARLGKENSSSEEMIRATADVELAQTQVMAAEEEIRQNLLEVKRIEVQLSRRTIRSPIDGIVTRIHHFNGEYITNSEPYVATVVDLSQLRLVFFVPSLEAEQLAETTSAEVRLERRNEIVSTTVDFVSPVTSADSGTVRVELLLDNKAGRHRSGLRCWLAGTSTNDVALPRFESATRLSEMDAFK